MNVKYIKEILSSLSADSYITAEALSKQLNVSEKTIRTKVKEINYELQKLNIKIESKPRYGYKLICDNYDNFKSIDLISNINNDMDYRIKIIFKYLIELDSEYIKSDDICDSLDISKTTLTNILKIMEYNLKYHNLKLERRPNYGIKLIGNEFDIRNFIICNYLNDFLYENNMNEKLIGIIINFLNKYEIKFSEINLENFIQYINVSINRIKNNKFICDCENDIVKDIAEEIRLSEELINQIQNEIDIEFNDTEILFIAIHIASKNLFSINENYNSVIQDKFSDIIDKMLDMVYKNLKIDLRNNFNLILLLNQHMIPLDIRIRYNIFQKNPMLNDIKNNYSLSFLLASESAAILKDYYNKDISEDEIGYLALLFQIGLEETVESINKMNILIVCGSGKTTSNLLVTKYRKEFNDYIENIYAADLIGLKEFDFSKVDYVFSTVPINLKLPVPIVYISNFLKSDDIINVKNTFESLNRNIILDYYKEEMFTTDIKGDTKEEIIKNICEEIKKYKSIPDNFYELVMKREQLAETDIGNLVAIPHPIEVVTKDTFVYVAVLDKPILWQKNNVQVVFLISVSNNNDDLKNFYEYTINFLLNENSVKKLIENKTFENLIFLIKSNSE
ncbi:transcriptional antiterminator, BglB [Brachyspira intermedia PWS/A]|uniref:Transcriptional antiterminator, BglB n=1 Tax=Brachyspira intermedia (strain ATCC 51140 / PWS/A) TaxID=1045858 RepID=G0EKR2_BRAIP|nr:PRD domain-containing protein [Brachyspira intermedia]AEM21370.1 transcriptional antiterminator, BglB [Brachyspira intermedia PWS/A]